VIEARDSLYWMVSGFRTTQMVRAAATLGVCDELAGGPLEATELASRVGADPGILRRLMRALSSFGVVAEAEDGSFSNTEVGELLRKDAKGSLRNVALGLAEDAWYEAWEQLPGAVRDGAVPFQRAFEGRSFWDVVEADPNVSARFNGFMIARTEAFAPELVAAFDFSQCSRVVDIGGGNGALTASVLLAYPGLQATVFDLDTGLEGADAYLRKRGVRDRCELVSGDFFESVPVDGDVYLLRHVLHDWDDDRAAAILATCRRGIRPGIPLLVIDQLLPRRASNTSEDRYSFSLDLHMYVLFGARERTEDELRQMLDTAGFRVERVAPTTPTSTLVARAI
jgi:ubiquinone/menaquinone biosynthesis C-methylase UbiE